MRIAPPAEPDGSMVETIARTVHHHLAMQAQDVGSGMWSVGVRTGATRADVEAAIEARQVTRSWPMRGTLHLMATQDVRWMCRLLNERMVATSGGSSRPRGSPRRSSAAPVTSSSGALAGGVALSRPARDRDPRGERRRPERAAGLPPRRPVLPGGAAVPGPGRGPPADVRAHRRVGAALVGAEPRGGDGRARHPLRRQPRTGDRARPGRLVQPERSPSPARP